MPQPTATSVRDGRRALDRRLGSWRRLGTDAAKPHGGWVRALRQAVAMTHADLAVRMGTEPSVVSRLELSERQGRIQLDTLSRAADALGCDVVYALVPRQTLDTIVQARAERVARTELAAVDHTMLLEDQSAVDDDDDDRRVREYAEKLLDLPGLWRDRP